MVVAFDFDTYFQSLAPSIEREDVCYGLEKACPGVNIVCSLCSWFHWDFCSRLHCSKATLFCTVSSYSCYIAIRKKYIETLLG